MAGLHVDRYEYAGTGGSAIPLLLIHGWAMHGGMWAGVAQKLAQHSRVMAVDLPGHGYSVGHFCPSPPDAGVRLDAIVDELAAQFDGPLALCGWSLGGQIALRWAMRYPQQVDRLVTVASTPGFVRRSGWDHALSVEILREFADDLQHHYALTLKRFLALQVRGGEQEREWLAVLRAALFSRGEPDLAALQGGLGILLDCDLRGALPDVSQPVLVLAGGRDMLVPPQAAQYMASRLANGRLAVIDGAAHAPFLSHPDEFVRHVVDFLDVE
jgi:pimeloyl-[acyl-carrier protein] methyl ester esterase